MSKKPEHFPYRKCRSSQKEAIEFILNEFLGSNKKFVILEAGTGVGKSAIGYTVAKNILTSPKKTVDYEIGSYFITTQKILQDQYLRDFSKHGMKSIKSSTNYQCFFHKQNNCSTSLRLLKNTDRESRFFKSCIRNCNYKNEKKNFIDGSLGVTNFPYFLAETSYSGKLEPRQLLVIDEAHNIETQLSNFVEITVSDRFSRKLLKIPMPDLRTQEQAFNWINNVYVPKLRSHIKHVEEMLEKYSGLKQKLKEFTTIARQYELLDKHASKINRFLQIYNHNNWVYNQIEAHGRSSKKIEFKPIDVSPYAEEMLFKFGEKVIMMSATILDKESFCESLGLNVDEVSFISIKSPFPAKNRPVYFVPIGRMNKSNIDNSLPKMAAAVRKILAKHKDQKGVIHTHTYKIANYIKKNVKDKRLLIHDGETREETLEKHRKSKRPTVLLSPSMTEGVDLANDASRFQVVCKIPYPYLGDKMVMQRMNRWKWWYPLQTVKTLIQSVGRSIRSSEDYAVTYILDEDFQNFFSRNIRYFNDSFLESYKH